MIVEHEPDTMTISVARDFSEDPGSRYIEDGPHSAEEFMPVLEPLFLEARQRGVKLLVDLDGVSGYATSFLQGSFGNLAAKYGSDAVNAVLRFKSEDDPYILRYIARYIREAHEVKKDKAK